MPVISIFYGIVVKIYYSDHNPPHFHAQYGDEEVIIEIKTGRVLNGTLPKRPLNLLRMWRLQNKDQILEAWMKAQECVNPGKVKPLE